MVMLNHPRQLSYLNKHYEFHIFFTLAYCQRNVVGLYFALIWSCTNLIQRNCKRCWRLRCTACSQTNPFYWKHGLFMTAVSLWLFNIEIDRGFHNNLLNLCHSGWESLWPVWRGPVGAGAGVPGQAHRTGKTASVILTIGPAVRVDDWSRDELEPHLSLLYCHSI